MRIIGLEKNELVTQNNKTNIIGTIDGNKKVCNLFLIVTIN